MTGEESEPVTLLKADSLSLTFADGDSQTIAVRDVTLELEGGQCVGVVGPSGSGKSSLLYLLSGLRAPTRGEVSLDGRRYADLSEREIAHLRRTQFGFVFQQHFLLGFLTALENILVATQSPRSAESRRKARDLLGTLGLEGKAHRLPHQLSGGERQRVAVARALISEPRVIFADEPTGLLDSAAGQQVMEVIMAQRARGSAQMVVSHDPRMLADADLVIEMLDGAIVSRGKPAAGVLPGR
jgi:putative ABC transport system ATP-binding protein